MDRYGMGFLASQLPKSKKGSLSNLSSSLLLLVTIVVISTIHLCHYLLSPLITFLPFYLENSASLFKYCEGKLNLVNKSFDHLMSGDAPSWSEQRWSVLVTMWKKGGRKVGGESWRGVNIHTSLTNASVLCPRKHSPAWQKTPTHHPPESVIGSPLKPILEFDKSNHAMP